MSKIQRGPRKGRSDSTRGAKPGEWEGRLRLWIDIGGRPGLGPGKIKLLDAIATTKSLSSAARKLNMSYRLAWKHLRLLEERTGVTVVEPQRGGRTGGGTALTPEGKTLLAAYHKFRTEVEEHMQSACHRHFAKWSVPSDPGD